MIGLGVDEGVVGCEAAPSGRPACACTTQVLRAVCPRRLLGCRSTRHMRIDVATCVVWVARGGLMRFSVSPVVIRAAVVGITMRGRVPALRPAMKR